MQEYEIVEEFEKIVDEATEDRSLKEYLEEVEDYGQNEFSYYEDTNILYDNYEQDCVEWLDNLVSETRSKPWDLFDNWDYAVNSEDNKYTVVAAMFEQYCNDRLEELDEEIED